jgi:hypothetical protein
LTPNKAKLCQNFIITLVFEKNANFVAENWQKSQKIVIITSTPDQGCQIFPDTIYQKVEKYTKWPLNYQTAIKCTKWPKNIPNISIPRPSKINPNWYFWFEKTP